MSARARYAEVLTPRRVCGSLRWSRGTQFALFALVAICTRLVVMGVSVVDSDEASYVVGATDLLRGGSLYVTYADHKPPLVYLYYAAWLALEPSLAVVRLATAAVWLPLTAVGVSAFLGYGRRGLVAGLLWLYYGAAFLAHDMLAVNCEVLMMLPVTWALVVARGPTVRPGDPSRLGVAGILVGVAVLFKYQAIAIVPALAIDAWVERGLAGMPGIAALGAGTLVPLGLAWAAFAAAGHADAFWYWNVQHNLIYLQHSAGPMVAVGRAMRYALPFLVVVAPLVWAWWRGRPTAERQVVLIALAACALLEAGAGGRFYPHYFIPLYVPLAIGAAPWVASATDPLSAEGRRFVATTALLLIVATVLNAILYWPGVPVYAERQTVYAHVAERVRRDPCAASASLFVWGFAPQFYMESGMRPATRFVYIDDTLVGHVSAGAAMSEEPSLIRADHWELLMRDLNASHPAFVLDASGADLFRWHVSPERFPEFSQWLARQYQLVDVVEGVRIFRRRSCSTGASPAADPT